MALSQLHVANICKHGKFINYTEDRSTWDKFCYGIVPIIQHCDLLPKIPKEFDLDYTCRLEHTN